MKSEAEIYLDSVLKSHLDNGVSSDQVNLSAYTTLNYLVQIDRYNAKFKKAENLLAKRLGLPLYNYRDGKKILIGYEDKLLK